MMRRWLLIFGGTLVVGLGGIGHYLSLPKEEAAIQHPPRISDTVVATPATAPQAAALPSVSSPPKSQVVQMTPQTAHQRVQAQHAIHTTDKISKPSDFIRQHELIEKRESKPDAQGEFERLYLIRDETSKYPLLRITQRLALKSNSTNETLLSEFAEAADHLLVKLNAGVSAKDLEQFNQNFKAEILPERLPNGQYLVQFATCDLDTLPKMIERYRQETALVGTAEEDGVHFVSSAIPNDADFHSLWGLNNSANTDIDAPEAWDIQRGSRSVVVGVIDSGIDYYHNDLKDNIWVNAGEISNNSIDDDHNGYIDDIHGWNFVENNNDPYDDHFHGTHCAGTIGAKGNNGLGVAGVCWEVSLMALKFINSGGYGFDSDAIAAIDYATRMKTRLTSNSWGGAPENDLLRMAIEDAGHSNSLFVVAAGNQGISIDVFLEYPASYECSNMICVAALDRNDKLAQFSNYGSMNVDLGAPGVAVYSTVPGQAYETYSGTSMATPHVAGVCALLIATFPELRADQIKDRLLRNTIMIPSLLRNTYSSGRLNAFKALTEGDPGAPAVPGNPTALALSSVAIRLDWADRSQTETGFTIERREDENGWAVLTQVPANTTSYIDRDIDCAHTYSYRLRSFNGAGNSGRSDTVSLAPLSGDAADPADDQASTTTSFFDLSDLTEASPLPLGARTLCSGDREDWIQLSLHAGNLYRFSAEGSGDLVADVYGDAQALQWLAGADDGEGLLNLVFRPAVDGLYYLRMQSYAPGQKAEYTLQASTLGAGTLPVATLVSPLPGATFEAPAALQLEAQASSAGGSITQVVFYAGKTRLGSVTQAPYRWNWPQVPAGVYRVYAQAFDQQGFSAISQPRRILVDGKPQVTLIDPKPEMTYEQAPADLPMTASALDPDDEQIQRVDFYCDRVLVGFDDSAPYYHTAKNQAQGWHTVQAVAHDNEGHAATSETVRVYVNGLPQINIETPLEGAVYPASSVIKVRTAPNDDNLSYVLFYNNRMVNKYGESVLLGVARQAPYEINLRLTMEGANHISAFAVDAFSQVAETSVTVNVTFPTKPAAPSDLRVTTLSNTKIHLAWQDNSVNESGFNLSRKQPTESTWNTIASFTDNATNYIDSGLAPGTIYQYKLRAYNAKGPSDETPVVTAQTQPYDPWDPLDDTAAGTTNDFRPTTQIQYQTGHSLSAQDTNDWYKLNLKGGHFYTFFSSGAGFLAAELFTSPDATAPVVSSDSHLFGENMFTLYYTPPADGWYYLRVRMSKAAPSAEYGFTCRDIGTDNRPSLIVTNPLDHTVFFTHYVRNLGYYGGLWAHAWSPAKERFANVEFFAKTSQSAVFSSRYFETFVVDPFANPMDVYGADFYTIVARGLTVDGLYVFSPPITIQTMILPEFISATPTDKSVFTEPNNVSLAFTASIPITNLILRIDDQTLYTAATNKLAYNWANPPPGTHTAKCLAQFWNTDELTSTVTFVVNVRPTVQIETPANGETFVAPATVTVHATAEDPGGQVDRVYLLFNDSVMHIWSEPPYDYTLTEVPLGSSTLRVEAVDKYGLSGENQREIVVRPPRSPFDPTNLTVQAIDSRRIRLAWEDHTPDELEFWIERISIGQNWTIVGRAQPNQTTFDDTNVLCEAQYGYRIRAWDSQNRDYYSDTVEVITPTGDPWDPLDDTVPSPVPNTLAINTTWQSQGPHTLCGNDSDDWYAINLQKGSCYRFLVEPATGMGAEIYRAANPSTPLVGDETNLTPSQCFIQYVPAASDSYYLRVYRRNPAVDSEYRVSYCLMANGYPSIQWATPADQSGFHAAQPVSLAVEAASGGGESVTQVQFYVDGKLIAKQTAPFTYDWTPPNIGSYTLQAVGFTSSDYGLVSDPRTIHVRGNFPPTIELLAPTHLLDLTNYPGSALISALAGDTDGWIERVDFLADGQLLFSDQQMPYVFEWNPVPEGIHLVTCVAVDNDGATTASQSVQVRAHYAPPELDAWDPIDDDRTRMPSVLTPEWVRQQHGPHTLNHRDSSDWFKLEGQPGMKEVQIECQSGTIAVSLMQDPTTSAQQKPTLLTVTNRTCVLWLTDEQANPAYLCIQAWPKGGNAIYEVSYQSRAADYIEPPLILTNLSSGALASYPPLSVPLHAWEMLEESISHVAFYAEDQLLAMDDAPPFSMMAPMPAPQDYAMRAVAYASYTPYGGNESVGLIVVSPTYLLRSCTPPTLQIGSSSDFTQGGVARLRSTVTPPSTSNGLIPNGWAWTSIVFRAHGDKIGAIQPPETSFLWSPLPLGNQTVTAVLYDKFGGATTSNVQSYYVKPYRDSDADGLPDIYETGTGIYRSPTDTGSYYYSFDSDSDGLGDGEEVLRGSNPNKRDLFYKSFWVHSSTNPLSVTAINENADIAGKITDGNKTNSFVLWARGLFQRLGRPGITDIGEQGLAIGNDQGIWNAWYWTQPGITRALSADWQLKLLDAQGRMAGSNQKRAWIWPSWGSEGGPKDIGLNAIESVVHAITVFTYDQVYTNCVGSYWTLTADGKTNQRAFVYRGVASDVGTLGGDSACALDTGWDANTIVGWSTLAGNNERHAFHYYRWASPPMRDLGTLGGNNSIALDIDNNISRIFGLSDNEAGVQRAFLYESTIGMKDVLSVIDAGDLPDGDIVDGRMNDTRQIALTVHKDGIWNIYLLYPHYEDFDNDGLPDAREREVGTLPNLKDTDADGLSDNEEASVYHTNPLKNDTDNDRIDDAYELQLGSDPTRKDSGPDLFLAIPPFAAGSAFSLRIDEDGRVWSWGLNTFGQLGRGHNNPANYGAVANLVSIRQIAARNQHALALDRNGRVWGWGNNQNGDLGAGVQGNHYATPFRYETLPTMQAVAAGSYINLGIRPDSTLWAWGPNWQGQLGNGSFGGTIATPGRVQGLTNVVAITAGAAHGLALKSDGSVWAWGKNQYGALGLGHTNNVATPTSVASLSGIAAIAACADHSLALKGDGTVWAWGRNQQGQLGLGHLTDAYQPVKIPGLKAVIAVRCGNTFSLALKADGSIWAWGQGATFGQLGQGSTLNSLTPIRVAVLTQVMSLDAGSTHSLAETDDGMLWSWGSDMDGECGDSAKHPYHNAPIPASEAQP